MRAVWCAGGDWRRVRVGLAFVVEVCNARRARVGSLDARVMRWRVLGQRQSITNRWWIGEDIYG
jgi:hypothetical protein